MTENESIKAEATLTARASIMLDWLTRPRLWIVAGIAVMAAGLALNWDWLTAVSAAPILLGVLPCAIMCALGLCMHRASGKSCSTEREAASRESSPAKET